MGRDTCRAVRKAELRNSSPKEEGDKTSRPSSAKSNKQVPTPKTSFAPTTKSFEKDPVKTIPSAKSPTSIKCSKQCDKFSTKSEASEPQKTGTTGLSDTTGKTGLYDTKSETTGKSGTTAKTDTTKKTRTTKTDATGISYQTAKKAVKDLDEIDSGDNPLILDLLEYFYRNVYNDPFRWSIVKSVLMFLVCVKVAKESNAMKIPVAYYTAFVDY